MEDDDELSFELLANANSRIIQRLLAQPRERLCEREISSDFQKMQGANRNAIRNAYQTDRRRRS